MKPFRFDSIIAFKFDSLLAPDSAAPTFARRDLPVIPLSNRLRQHHGTGNSSKIFWMMVSLDFSSASAS